MGKWTYSINLHDVFHNDMLSFEQRRDAIIGRLKRSTWLRDMDEFDTVPQLLEELSETETEDAFDDVWAAIYDEADADRVWINTVGVR